MNGRLIGPKTWERIVRIFFEPLDSPRTVCGRCGLLGCDLCIKSCIVMCMRPEMTMNFGFHEVESMLDSGREQ